MSVPDKFIDTTPYEGIGPSQRTNPLRLPDHHHPPVQRWSALLPRQEVFVGLFGVQWDDEGCTSATEMHDWVRSALLSHTDGPIQCDRARFIDKHGMTNEVFTGYWLDGNSFRRWRDDRVIQRWWESPERLQSEVGIWREIMQIPSDRFESIYWADYLGGLSSNAEVRLFRTKYSAYYGAMRDRILASANDTLDKSTSSSSERQIRQTEGARWRIAVPANFAMIRSAHSWGMMDMEQYSDYSRKIAPPVKQGMTFLQDNSEETGCLDLRWQTTIDDEGKEVPELHATGFFDCLKSMEAWAEDHKTHASIFRAAMQRFKQYGPKNQLRTWHEVWVLPEDGYSLFEYTNCHADTGLVSYYSGKEIAST